MPLAVTVTEDPAQGGPAGTVASPLNVANIAGAALIGKVGIDQTTQGVTNGVALVAGTAIAGKVGIDQTTPGTTNAVAIPSVTPAAPLAVSQYSGPPAGATPLNSSSGNVAAAAATATLAALAAKFTYLTQLDFTGAGATAASVVTGTITGLLGGTRSFTIAVPAGVAVGITPLALNFIPPLQGSAVNTAIVVSVPSLGVGNTNATLNAQGFNA
jgi:hypothetical protein